MSRRTGGMDERKLGGGCWGSKEVVYHMGYLVVMF